MNKRIKQVILYGIIVSTPIILKPKIIINKSFQADAVGYKNIVNSALAFDIKQLSEDDSIAAMEILNNKQSLNFRPFNEELFSKLGFKYFTEKKLDKREIINFGTSSSYADLKGITTFRGNNMRDSGSFGTVKVKEEKLYIVWKKDIGAIDNWTGVGWNGQPAIVEWDKAVIDKMNIYNHKKSLETPLREVVYATLDGNVYFLDLNDGSATRDKLNIGAPIKGSVTIDPRGYPLLYVGQGINKNGSKVIDFAYRIFSLNDFKKLYEIKGRDSFAKRNWGAFDSTALVDKSTDSLFLCGENGVFYSGKLNTSYENGNISVNPQIDKYRYDAVNKDKKGIENSIAVYKNYGFFADNDGLLQCIDLNSLKPVWVIDVNDDTDSTVVLERDESGLSLYTATEVDKQRTNGYSYVRKIDATNGKIIWENKYKCAYMESVNGGALATPILGKKDISDLVIFNIARTPEFNSGQLVAINKKTGEEVWKLKLVNYCWSSPVAVYTEEGKSYIVQSDSTGKTYLIEGISGRILDTIELGANVEGSPSAFNGKFVVGTRGGKIIGFEIK